MSPARASHARLPCNPSTTPAGTGTGLIYDAAAGLIVTNAHVASASKRTTVTLASGKNVTAELWGRSSSCDVALLRVDPADASLVDEGPPPVLGSSATAELGEHAVAIGYSAEQFMTSVGIVSALSTRRGFTGLGRPGQARQREGIEGEASTDTGSLWMARVCLLLPARPSTGWHRADSCVSPYI